MCVCLNVCVKETEKERVRALPFLHHFVGVYVFYLYASTSLSVCVCVCVCVCVSVVRLKKGPEKAFSSSVLNSTAFVLSPPIKVKRAGS